MASNKEILEARRYNRHRALTAFVSGTPDDRELDSRLPQAPIIAGVVLCAVLVVVGLVLGRFSPTLPAGWENNQLIVVTDSGSRYFTIDGVLHPVTNVTSARLLADPGQFGRPIEVPAKLLAGKSRGATVGLPDLPDYLPTPSADVGKRWTACPDAAGTTHVWVGDGPQGLGEAATSGPTPAAVVKNGDAVYVVAAGRYHRVETDAGIDLPFALGLGHPPVAVVTAEWLNLLAKGPALKSLPVPGAGRPAADLPANWPAPRIGQLVTVSDNGPVQRYVISGPGQLTELTEVAYRLWDLGQTSGAAPVIEARSTEVAQVTVAPANALYPAEWPAQLTALVQPGQLPCLRWLGGGDDPTPKLAAVPQASVEKVPPTEAAPVIAHVAGGSAALIRVSTGGTLGSVRLITDTRLAYGLGNDPEASLTQLGFDNDMIVDVPQAWATLVPSAPTELSRDAVWATVQQ